MSNPWNVMPNCLDEGLKEIMAKQECDRKSTDLVRRIQEMESYIDPEIVHMGGQEHQFEGELNDEVTDAMADIDLELSRRKKFDSVLEDNDEFYAFSDAAYNRLKSMSSDIAIIKPTNAKPKKPGFGDVRQVKDVFFDEEAQNLHSKLQNHVITELCNKRDLGNGAYLYQAPRHPDYVNWSKYKKSQLPKIFTVKVFNTLWNDSNRERNIRNDSRFKDRINPKTASEIANIWAEKEEMNLRALRKAGIRCPKVFERKDNVLVMSTVGSRQSSLSSLKLDNLTRYEKEEIFRKIAYVLYNMFQKAGMVHGNLSEQNVVYHKDQCWITDVPQAMLSTAPGALTSLLQDCEKLVKFFERHDVYLFHEKKNLFHWITGLEIFHCRIHQLEEIHRKSKNKK